MEKIDRKVKFNIKFEIFLIQNTIIHQISHNLKMNCRIIIVI